MPQHFRSPVYEQEPVLRYVVFSRDMVQSGTAAAETTMECSLAGAHVTSVVHLARKISICKWRRIRNLLQLIGYKAFKEYDSYGNSDDASWKKYLMQPLRTFSIVLLHIKPVPMMTETVTTTAIPIFLILFDFCPLLNICWKVFVSFSLGKSPSGTSFPKTHITDPTHPSDEIPEIDLLVQQL